MLINTVIYTIPEEKADEAERFLRELAVASRAEEGCLGYEVVRGNEPDRGTFVLFEKWRDQAALDAHSKGPMPGDTYRDWIIGRKVARGAPAD